MLKLVHFVFIFILFLFGPLISYSQEECSVLNNKPQQLRYGASRNNECCVDSVMVADSLLLNLEAKEKIIKYNSPFGLPKSKNKNEILIINPHYLVGYDTVNKIPMWVQYRLTKPDEKDNISRTDCFRYDPRISKKAQTSYNGYSNRQNLQRGHMKPSSDSKRNLSENLNSFVMTNMAPQYGELNQCEWLLLEDFVRHHSQQDSVEEAYIISGSVVTKNSKWLNDSVRIPIAFYKIYFFKSSNKWHYWTYYLNHDRKMMEYESYKEYLMNEQLTIREIEKKCKHNFYVTIPGKINKVEKRLDNTFSLIGLEGYKFWCSRYKNKSK